MGGLLGGHHTRESKLAGIQVQTSLLGQPIPIGWGRARIGCNLIDYVAFTAIPKTTKTGGKGGSSSTTYSYSASVILALCEGPITGVRTVYRDTSVITLSAAGLTLFTGGITQAPWGYMSSLYPSHALGYSSLAYVCAQDYPLGTGASLPNHGFEIDFAIQYGPNGDADPRDITTDFLTNVSYGVTGWGAGLIGDLSDWSLYCRANNLLLSPLLESSTTGIDFLKRLSTATNSEFWWSEGVLKAKSYGDSTITGNGVTWTPNLTPVYDLTEDSFLDEVHLEVINQADAHNYVQVEYLDRSNQYQPAVAIAQDLNDIITYGLRKRDPEQMHDICDANIAQQVVQLRLQQALYIRDRYTFTLPEDFVGLEPMDYVTLSTTVDGMVLNRQLVLIEQIDETPDGDLTVTATGVPGQTASAAQYAAHASAGFQPAVETPPGNVAAPYLFNAPTSLTGQDHEIWCAVSGGPNWGGAQVWGSVDNVTYSYVGTIRGPARYGILTSALALQADPDTTSTLAVDLSQSGGVLGAATHAEADAGASLCLVGTELLAFADTTLTSANHYNLSYLRRGLHNSAIAAHAAGDHFIRLDDGIFKIPYPTRNVGNTFYVKFQSFNLYGRALQNLAAVSPYSVTLAPQLTGPTSPLWLGNLTGAAQINVNASYTGAITDALPRTQQYTFITNGQDVTTSTTWSVVVLAGTMSATIGAATGILSIDKAGGSLTSGRVRITANYGGSSRQMEVKITVNNSAIPPAPAAGATTVAGNVNGGISSTTMVAVSDALTVTVGSGGNVALSANYAITAATYQAITIQTQWYKWNGTAYVALASATQNTGPASCQTDPAYGANSYTDSGNTASSTQKYQLFAKMVNGASASLSGDCSASGS